MGGRGAGEVYDKGSTGAACLFLLSVLCVYHKSTHFLQPDEKCFDAQECTERMQVTIVYTTHDL